MRAKLLLILLLVLSISELRANELSTSVPLKIGLGYSAITLQSPEDIDYQGIDIDLRLSPNDKPGLFYGLQINYHGYFAEDYDMMSVLAVGATTGIRFGRVGKNETYQEWAFPIQVASFFNYPGIEDDDGYSAVCISPTVSLGYSHFMLSLSYSKYVGRLEDIGGYSIKFSYLF